MINQTPKKAAQQFFRALRLEDKPALSAAIQKTAKEREEYKQALKGLRMIAGDKPWGIYTVMSVDHKEAKGFPKGTIADVNGNAKIGGILYNLKVRVVCESSAYIPTLPPKGKWGVNPFSVVCKKVVDAVPEIG